MPAALTGPGHLSFDARARLAIDGGLPRLAHSRLAAWPPLSPDEEVRVVQALGRKVVADRTSRMVTRLERAWAGLTGCTRVVACRSGSVAVRLAAASLGLEPGDEVIAAADTAAIVDVLCSSSGAVPVLVDLDPETLQIDPAAVEAAITHRSRAILSVDRYGTTPDYTALTAVARAHGLTVIEDASQSVGAHFDGRPAGDLAAGSVCTLPGEAGSSLGAGGLFATSDEQMSVNARRVLLVDDDIGSEPLDHDPAWLGWTYRIPEADAAAAHTHLRSLDEETPARARSGNRLRRRLADMAGIRLPEPTPKASHVHTSFPLLVQPDELGLPETSAAALRDTLIDCMAAEGLWVEPARPIGCSRSHAMVDGQTTPELPTFEAVLSAGLVLGEYRSPFLPGRRTTGADRPGDRSRERGDDAAVDDVAECFSKVLVDNVARLRQLTMERLATTPLI